MWRQWRARQPGAPWWRIAWWYLLHSICFWWFAACYRYRARGVNQVPATGPVLLVSNHQSFLDPIAVGLGAHRRQFHALARASLFANPWFGWLIRSLNAIAVDQNGSDMAAMRRCLRALEEQHALLVFPEGARTPDGRTKDFAPGTLLLIKRARPVVVPVAIEGAFEAWPRSRKLPRLFGRIEVMFGQPLEAQALLQMGTEAALGRLRDTVESMRLQLRQGMRRSG